MSVQAGDRRMVFDAEEWRRAGGDVGDNSRFMHPARILAVMDEPEPWGRHRQRIATVRFEHDGRVSHGHFVSGMYPVQ